MMSDQKVGDVGVCWIKWNLKFTWNRKLGSCLIFWQKKFRRHKTSQSTQNRACVGSVSVKEFRAGSIKLDGGQIKTWLLDPQVKMPSICYFELSEQISSNSSLISFCLRAKRNFLKKLQHQCSLDFKSQAKHAICRFEPQNENLRFRQELSSNFSPKH